MSRPANYYDMTYEQRQAHERAERERRDLEYDREQAQEQAERAERDARRAAEAARAERASHEEEAGQYREEIYDLQETVRDLRNEMALRKQFLAERGLAAEYDEWAARQQGKVF